MATRHDLPEGPFLATNLGFPRIGAGRELKRALEDFWAGRSDAHALQRTARDLRARHWKEAAALGLDHVPCGDFSLYDHVLDTAVMVGAVPARYRRLEGWPERQYFAMARGLQQDAWDVPALEMTKWFDTNYHYLVPELEEGMDLRLSSRRLVDELAEARALGVPARPVLLGPVTFLRLSKTAGDRWKLLPALLSVYEQLLAELRAAGASWVQIDEPALVTDLEPETREAYRQAYERLAIPGCKLLVATYFGSLGENAALAADLPVAGLHVDLVRGAEGLDDLLPRLGADKVLSMGVVDGRNVWRADLDRALALVRRGADALGPARVWIAPSCSLLHCPVDLDGERGLDPELMGWLAFATQKLGEVRAIAEAARTGRAEGPAFEESRRVRAQRSASPRIHAPAVAARLAALPSDRRASHYPERRLAQRDLGLPFLPTTTIGSFPQTAEVRSARAAHREGRTTDVEYEAFLEAELERTIRLQEELGLDVLVHGEFERNDMVEYFGERLAGFAFTRNGWVQSYGSRCVKPPIIYGDVSRPAPMTVDWAKRAQALTTRPVKGMLTGPVTILQWSFVRDDQPRAQTCRQLALAVRDEVGDLEAAGIRIIQIDEPAIREGLPLRRRDWNDYLGWAVESFRLASSGVKDGTQIHTHMCYSEFNDIMDAVVAMDADVVSIESSRSRMELLEVFGKLRYPNEIGPGVWDIHSPRVPSQAEMVELLRRAAAVIAPEQLWVNPDCGLKTRGWPETVASLRAMVAAARELRREVAARPR